MRDSVRSFLADRRTETAITILILLNAITLGFETSETVMARYGALLTAFDKIILAVFVIELLARAYVHRLRFFHDPWRVFDFIVVGIALIPATGALSVLRALRILRILRLVSIVPSLRRVVGGLVAALPGMGSIVVLLVLVFYVFAVIATKLFGSDPNPDFQEWFGSIGASAYTLFQVMTLESWSMGIVRPVMAVYPWAWTFFLPFILCTTFTVLNLFIGIIVSAMQAEHEATADEAREKIHKDQELIAEEIARLSQEVRALRSELAEKRS
ncbi:MAG: ion transporter [Hyphomicrobiaceae bacterium]|nr:ion transporter [Hyphomicrobiaceae bacterium]